MAIWQVDTEAAASAGSNYHTEQESMTDVVTSLDKEMSALTLDDWLGEAAEAFTDKFRDWVKLGTDLLDDLEQFSSGLGVTTGAGIAGTYETAHKNVGGKA